MCAVLQEMGTDIARQEHSWKGLRYSSDMAEQGAVPFILVAKQGRGASVRAPVFG